MSKEELQRELNHCIEQAKCCDEMCKMFWQSGDIGSHDAWDDERHRLTQEANRLRQLIKDTP